VSPPIIAASSSPSGRSARLAWLSAPCKTATSLWTKAHFDMHVMGLHWVAANLTVANAVGAASSSPSGARGREAVLRPVR